jgi:hypothetical protein
MDKKLRPLDIAPASFSHRIYGEGTFVVFYIQEEMGRRRSAAMTSEKKDDSQKGTDKGSEKEKDPRADFLRLSAARTKAIANKIRLLGNLSERRFYDYKPEEIESIFSTIEEDVARARSRFDEALQKEINPGPSKNSKK